MDLRFWIDFKTFRIMFFFRKMFLTRSVKNKNVFDKQTLETLNFSDGLVKTVRKNKTFSKNVGGAEVSKMGPPRFCFISKS